MTIAIDIINTQQDLNNRQTVSIEITNNGETFAWSRGGIPSDWTEAQIQTRLDSEADALWRAAAKRGQRVNTWEQVNDRQLMRAGMLVLLDEINRMRVLSALNPYTEQQFLSAIKNKLQS